MNDEQKQTGIDFLELMEAHQQALHMVLGKLSQTMAAREIDQARTELEKAEMKVQKLKLRFL